MKYEVNKSSIHTSSAITQLQRQELLLRMEYEYEKDRDGNPVDAYPDEKNHSIDAVRYALNRIWQRKGM